MISLSAGVVVALLLVLALSAVVAFSMLREARSLLAGRGAQARGLVLAAGGVGLVAFGLRLSVAEGHISWSPYLDQWGAEISGVVVPLSKGTLGWRDLVAGNNEHRVLLTRCLTVATIEVNGCWDNRVLVVLNYVFEASLVAWVSFVSWCSLGWLAGSYVALAALVPMGLACDWEGIMWSNQTQFILMAFTSVLAFTLLRGPSLGSAAAWGALCAAVLAMASMVSGFLTPLSLMATVAVVAFASRSGFRPILGFSAICVLLGAAGWETRAHFTDLNFLYAKSVGDWLESFMAYGTWPLPSNLLGLLGLWLPSYLLLRRTLVRRQIDPLASFALGLGLWVILQACALSWARSGLNSLVSSRYTDFLGWGVVSNAVALLIVCRGVGATARSRMIARCVLVCWLAWAGGSEIWRSQKEYRAFYENFRSMTLEHERRLGTFMRNGDATQVKGQEFPHIPHYNPDLITGTLLDADVQPLLPGPLRRDLVRERHPERVASVRDGPLSLLAVVALKLGGWFQAAGLGLVAAGAWLTRRSPGVDLPGLT